MKSEDTIKRAFRNLQKAFLDADAGKGRMNPMATSTMITLAWILDLLPPRSDEVNSARMLGDLEKNLADYCDPMEIINTFRTVKV